MQYALFAGLDRAEPVKMRSPAPFKTQLLKWIGNKQKLAHEIIGHFPAQFGAYYEPFLGAGGVMATLAPSEGYGSDVFAPLIEIWAALAERPFVVGFAAETENLLDNARSKLLRKGLDLVIANDVSDVEIGFGSDDNQVLLISAFETLRPPRMNKAPLARLLIDHIATLMRTGGAAPIMLNAANEVAVAAFLAGRIGFLDIERVISSGLQRSVNAATDTLEAIVAIDYDARRAAECDLQGFSS